MRAVVAFDSFYGNTRKVAEMIAADLLVKGHEAVLVNVREMGGGEVDGDVLFLGSPTRMGRMTWGTRAFAKHLDRDRWRGKRGYPFDTVFLSSDENGVERKAMPDGGAAPRIAELMKRKGLMVSGRPLRIEVVGMKGPLASNAQRVVKEFIEQELHYLSHG